MSLNMNKVLKNLGILIFFILLWFIFSRHSMPLFLPKPESVIDCFIALIKKVS